MRFYFNGCSLTYGDELKNPQESSWPSLVASSLNADFKNDAVSGGTNDRILYRTLINTNDYDYFLSLGLIIADLQNTAQSTTTKLISIQN